MFQRSLLRRCNINKLKATGLSSGESSLGHRILGAFVVFSNKSSSSWTFTVFERIRTKQSVLQHSWQNQKSFAALPLPHLSPADVTMSNQSVKIEGVNAINGNPTIIRYQKGDARFQMQVVLNNGKTFNFDRSCSDSVSSVVARMTTNFVKKMKTFNGTIQFVTEGAGTSEGGDEVEISRIFDVALADASQSALKLQVGEDVYNIVFNPPEIYGAKFFPSFMLTFPLFPYRIETSTNFNRDASIYMWEFSTEKPSPTTPPKLRKMSKDISEPQNAKTKSLSSWVECGSSLIFTPEKHMEGGYLRFTCTPSNGLTLGKPYTMTLPNSIEALPVDKFLYEERLSRLTPKSMDGDVFRVLSYNALADTYATPEWFISSPKESLDVGYRMPILNKEIQSYNADIICLQEVDQKYFEGNFQPYLELQGGYKGSHTSKIGNTKEGIATFYNPGKLTRIKFLECVILEHMKTLPMWDRLKKMKNEFTQRLEERNTVFHLSVFQVNSRPDTLILVGNVHLYFHPDADHIRLLQTITCISFLESNLAQLKVEYPNHKITVIYCGDLNCTPPFSSYRLLTSGIVDENDEDWSSHSEEKIVPGIVFKHSLNLSNSNPGEELTNITTCFEGCLDYILYQSEYFQLLSVYPPPCKEKLAKLMKIDDPIRVSLPNLYTPSDHLPIITDLKLKR